MATGFMAPQPTAGDTATERAIDEEIVDPDLPIIDSHHHLRDRPADRYLFPDLLADLASGHNIVATIAVENSAMYRAAGPPELSPVGETEFLNGMAAMSASGQYGPTIVGAGIVAYADLLLGARVEPVLHAVIAAGGGLVRGIRNPVAWHADGDVRRLTRTGRAQGLLRDPAFREAVLRLRKFDLSLDVWVYHEQIPELIELARAVPDTRLVVDHVGGPLGVGPYAGKRDQVFTTWRECIKALASLSNVSVKLGGLGMPIMGFGFEKDGGSADSLRLARAWRPYIEVCIEAFGPARCMFESNFPPDRVSTSYRNIWNAFKRVVADCSDDEKRRMFAGTAAEVYGISLPAQGARSRSAF